MLNIDFKFFINRASFMGNPVSTALVRNYMYVRLCKMKVTSVSAYRSREHLLWNSLACIRASPTFIPLERKQGDRAILIKKNTL